MKLRVLILGYGEMGHAMEYLLAARHDVRIWNLGEVVRGSHATLEEEVAEAQVVLFCLPVNPHFEIASRIAPYLAKESLCLSIAKGLDESGRTAAQVFERAFDGDHHYGVIYGPMISEEIRRGRHAFADAVLSDCGGFRCDAQPVPRQHPDLPAGIGHARQELVRDPEECVRHPVRCGG